MFIDKNDITDDSDDLVEEHDKFISSRNKGKDLISDFRNESKEDSYLNYSSDKKDNPTDNNDLDETDNAKDEMQSSATHLQVDEPVRLYLKDMGKVPLLSREGEIEIAQQIESQSIDLLRILYRIPISKEVFNKGC